MMYELTNEQRKCFGLAPVQEHWRKIMVKPGPYDHDDVYLYLDGHAVVKYVAVGEKSYSEYELCEQLSDDDVYLLPKTQKGKPVRLSISTITKRKSVGMYLTYYEDYIGLHCSESDCDYFTSSYTDEKVHCLQDFAKWVEMWCAETSQEDILDVTQFAKQKRKHVRYKEGDVFRFKIDRRLYGYGRLILDYGKMRKEKTPFWDILMGKPLVCSVYHIATERCDVTVEELKDTSSLPSCFMMDNKLFYGEYEIIGNIPLMAREDYPIMYGCSIDAQESRRLTCLQWGRIYKTMELAQRASQNFLNNGIGFRLNLTREILLQCVMQKSNDPYWQLYYTHKTERDLRNPKHCDVWKQIQTQFGLKG